MNSVVPDFIHSLTHSLAQRQLAQSRSGRPGPPADAPVARRRDPFGAARRGR